MVALSAFEGCGAKAIGVLNASALHSESFFANAIKNENITEIIYFIYLKQSHGKKYPFYILLLFKINNFIIYISIH